MTKEQIYAIATRHLGMHLTLNQNVPAEVGCAEAWSWIMLNCGFAIPHGGIPNVNGAIAWMEASNLFEEIFVHMAGAVITAHRPDRTDPEAAHIGICLNFGVASNNSDGPDKGKFTENFRGSGAFENYFEARGAIIRYFIPKI